MPDPRPAPDIYAILEAYGWEAVGDVEDEEIFEEASRG